MAKARARALMDKKRYSGRRELWEEAPELKEFKPRCKNLDILEVTVSQRSWVKSTGRNRRRKATSLGKVAW